MRRALRSVGLALGVLAAVFFIARAVVEIVTVAPSRPEEYREDWGGPTYLGVLLVHAGPGVLAVVLLTLALRRRARNRRNGPRSVGGPP
jgi:hypothetical protein